MAQGIGSPDNSESCCIGGFVVHACTHCGAHPRKVSTCKRCGGAGITKSPCPVHAAYTSTGYTVQAGTTYGENTGYGSSYGGNTGYGQGYGSTSGHY